MLVPVGMGARLKFHKAPSGLLGRFVKSVLHCAAEEPALGRRCIGAHPISRSDHLHVEPSLWTKKKGAARAAPWVAVCSGLVDHRVAASHPEGVLVRVQPEKHGSDNWTGTEPDGVEAVGRDPVQDLVDDLEDAVEDRRADPADVGLWVKPGDDD